MRIDKRNISGHNVNRQRHGYWKQYHTTDNGIRKKGEFWFKGTYNNGIEVGYFEFHDSCKSQHKFFIR